MSTVFEPTIDTINWDDLAPSCERYGYKYTNAAHCKGDPAAYVVSWDGLCNCWNGKTWLFCAHCSGLSGPCGICGTVGAVKIVMPL